MLMYLLAMFVIGVIFGYYMGNKKFQRAISRAFKAFKKSKDEDELYYPDEED